MDTRKHKDNLNKKNEKPSLVIRLFKETKSFWLMIVGIFLLEMLATPLALLTPIPIKIVVDNILGSDKLPGFLRFILPETFINSEQTLLILVVALQILIVFLVHMQYLGSYVLQTSCGQSITLIFREKLFRHVQRLSFMFHDTRGTADSIYRIQYDAPAIQNIAVYGVIPLASSVVKLIAMVFVITRINYQLTLIALSIAPLLFIFTQTFNSMMKRKYRDIKRVESSVLNIIQEVLTAVRVVKAFGREEHEQERFVDHSGQLIKKRIWLSYAESLFGLLINLTTAVGTAAILYVGVKNVQAKSMTLGELIIVITYINMLYSPLKSISKETANLQSSIVSAQRAFELLDEVPDVVNRPDAKHIDRFNGAVEYKNVSFSYDGRTQVLKKISFAVPAGARVGIIGKTGAGKTSLVSLLPRFYDPSEGQILIDGVDIREYKLEDLRNQFSIVLQEALLFSTSIRENIAYAKHGVGDKEIIEAAKAANAHDFIMQLPDKYDTLVGERGMRISGGERQRISLARAFLKNAPILLFDEPTSSVDTKTETFIMDAMDRLMKGRTTFMIAHRLSTVDKCDVLLEVVDGEVKVLRSNLSKV